MNHGLEETLNGDSALLFDEEDERPSDSKEVPLFNEITKDLNSNFVFSLFTTMDSGKNLESFLLTHKPIVTIKRKKPMTLLEISKQKSRGEGPTKIPPTFFFNKSKGPKTRPNKEVLKLLVSSIAKSTDNCCKHGNKWSLVHL